MGLETEIIPHLEEEFAGEVMVPAREIPYRVQKVIRMFAGGCDTYIRGRDLVSRDEQIRGLFTGANIQQLVIKFGMTERRIRQILSKK